MSNPLGEAQSDSLNELFSRNPLEVTPEEDLLIVQELRRFRALLDKAQGEGKRAPRVKAPGKVLPVGLDISLDELKP